MVSINPGVALGGAILGITPGAALEKKSVRDIAAGFAANKLGEWLSSLLHLVARLFSSMHDRFSYDFVFFFDSSTPCCVLLF